MFILQTTSCAALFYAIRQFFAIAIFFMAGLAPMVCDRSYGVACEVTRQGHHIASVTLLYWEQKPDHDFPILLRW